ncbi:zinc ribbon domain-containing protein [bacterium]|nr:zinc ribbon domain-containing protein [bacterium]
MEQPFEKVKKEFNQLKQKHRQKKISDRQFKSRLKKLRLRDQKGRWWTIGAQTGKWYYFDGERWIQAEPPSQNEGKAICIHCGYENDLDAEVCEYCGEKVKEEEKKETKYLKEEEQAESQICPQCGQLSEFLDGMCSHCGASLDQEVKGVPKAGEKEERVFRVFHTVHYLSFLLFWGAVGLFAGLLLGVFTGTTEFFTGIVQALPSFIVRIDGTLVRGIFYGILGGIFGFGILGLGGLLIALIINAVSSLIGGIKIRMD